MPRVEDIKHTISIHTYRLCCSFRGFFVSDGLFSLGWGGEVAGEWCRFSEGRGEGMGKTGLEVDMTRGKNDTAH